MAIKNHTTQNTTISSNDYTRQWTQPKLDNIPKARSEEGTEGLYLVVTTIYRVAVFSTHIVLHYTTQYLPILHTVLHSTIAVLLYTILSLQNCTNKLTSNNCTANTGHSAAKRLIIASYNISKLLKFENKKMSLSVTDEYKLITYYDC